MKKIILTTAIIILLTGCGNVKLKNGENALVEFKDGNISSDQLYNSLKESYGTDKLIELIDTELLNKKYETTKEEKEYVDQNLKKMKESAKSSNISFDLYLKYYFGVSSEKAYKNNLSLQFKRKKCTEDYAKGEVTDKQIKEYYESEVFGDIDAKHILIEIDAKEKDSEETKKAADEKALKLANSIIEKLNKNEDFDKLAKEYSNDSKTAKNGGKLGKVNKDNYTTEVVDELLNLKDKTYSTRAIKSSYGYHIVYRISQDEKPKLDDNLKKKIIENVAKELATDSLLQSQALISLREDNKIKILDSDLNKEYTDIVNQTKNSANTNNNNNQEK